jgi:hypothetical protein
MRVTQAFQQLSSRGKFGNRQRKLEKKMYFLSKSTYFSGRNFSQTAFEDSGFDPCEGRLLEGQMLLQLSA